MSPFLKNERENDWTNDLSNFGGEGETEVRLESSRASAAFFSERHSLSLLVVRFFKFLPVRRSFSSRFCRIRKSKLSVAWSVSRVFRTRTRKRMLGSFELFPFPNLNLTNNVLKGSVDPINRSAPPPPRPPLLRISYFLIDLANSDGNLLKSWFAKHGELSRFAFRPVNIENFSRSFVRRSDEYRVDS